VGKLCVTVADHSTLLSVLAVTRSEIVVTHAAMGVIIAVAAAVVIVEVVGTIVVAEFSDVSEIASGAYFLVYAPQLVAAALIARSASMAVTVATFPAALVMSLGMLFVVYVTEMEMHCAFAMETGEYNL